MTDPNDWTLDLRQTSAELLDLALRDLAAINDGDETLTERSRRERAARALEEVAERLRSYNRSHEQVPAVWIEPGPNGSPDCYRVTE